MPIHRILPSLRFPHRYADRARTWRLRGDESVVDRRTREGREGIQMQMGDGETSSVELAGQTLIEDGSERRVEI